MAFKKSVSNSLNNGFFLGNIYCFWFLSNETLYIIYEIYNIYYYIYFYLIYTTTTGISNVSNQHNIHSEIIMLVISLRESATAAACSTTRVVLGMKVSGKAISNMVVERSPSKMDIRLQVTFHFCNFLSLLLLFLTSYS